MAAEEGVSRRRVTGRDGAVVVGVDGLGLPRGGEQRYKQNEVNEHEATTNMKTELGEETAQYP